LILSGTTVHQTERCSTDDDRIIVANDDITLTF